MGCMYGVFPPYRTLNSIRLAKAKYVVWSQDMSHVAILGRNGERLITYVHLSSVVLNLTYMYTCTCTEIANFCMKNDCSG